MFGKEFGDDIPFLLFEFQKDFVKGIWDSIQEASLPSEQRINYTDVFIEKSRQMGVSWMLAGVFLYGFIFHQHRYLMLSAKEDLVDK
jgi:phage terminase large subunit-like protein